MTTTTISWDLFWGIAMIGTLGMFGARIMRKINKKESTISLFSKKQKQMKEREIVLTEEEKKSMKLQLVVVLGFASFIITMIIGFIAFDYWKFALHGTVTQATVIKRDVHKSTGRHRRRTYTYTLESHMNGEDIVDTTGTGKNGSYSVGAVVDAYAVQSEGKTDLAIKNVIDASPTQGIIPLGLGGVFWGFGVVKWRQIRKGKMKFKELPKKFQQKRIGTVH